MSLEIEYGHVEVKSLGFHFKLKTTGLHLLSNFPDSQLRVKVKNIFPPPSVDKLYTDNLQTYNKCYPNTLLCRFTFLLIARKTQHFLIAPKSNTNPNAILRAYNRVFFQTELFDLKTPSYPLLC